MGEEMWKPLYTDDEGAANHDVLHDGVQPWMAESFWIWMTSRFTIMMRPDEFTLKPEPYFNNDLLRDVERVCRISVPFSGWDVRLGVNALRKATEAQGTQLRVADYLLSKNDPKNKASDLEVILHECGSLWTLGTRAGRPGLVKRMPEGVQIAAEATMNSSGKAGVQLRKAWESAFGLHPNPGEAYRLAVCAVEDATIPLVIPNQDKPTLGMVIPQLRQNADWSLPFTCEDPRALTWEIVVNMCQALWTGHIDRHGGDTPISVSQEEAEAAVTLAIPLVQWFTSGNVARRPR